MSSNAAYYDAPRIHDDVDAAAKRDRAAAALHKDLNDLRWDIKHRHRLSGHLHRYVSTPAQRAIVIRHQSNVDSSVQYNCV